MDKKLLVVVLGKKNSGKSTTWQSIFNRTAQKSLRKLAFKNKEYTDVFLINGSPQERQLSVENIIQVESNPNIVLCSLQYTNDAKNSLRYFAERTYFIYLHWLNPGYGQPIYMDHLHFIDEVLKYNSLFGKRDGNIEPTSRSLELKQYIYYWAKENNLLKTSSTL